MDQIFPFSLPEEIIADPQKMAQLRILCAFLDKLQMGKIDWEQFLEAIPLSHPLLRFASTKNEKNTLLHLAVIDNQKSLVESLARDSRFRLKRNSFGLTPFEIACFLSRRQTAQILKPESLISFSSQHNVSFVDCRDDFSHLEYLSHPIFETEEGFAKILTQTQKAKLKDRIPPEKIWMGIYFDKEIQTGFHPPVSIRFVDPEVGYGVFAEQKISSCTYVGEYTGMIQERKRKHLKNKYYCVRYTVWEMGRKHFVIDAEKRGNFTRFINHSAQPNLSLLSVYWRGLPRMIFVALEEIAAGVQLTFDYGTFFWKECSQTPKLF